MRKFDEWRATFVRPNGRTALSDKFEIAVRHFETALQAELHLSEPGKATHSG